MIRLDFYAAAAQVIPVLFIVLAFQMRYFEAWGEGRLERITRRIDLLIVVVAVIGEIAALHALQVGHGSGATEFWVESALIALGLGIAWLTIRDFPGRLRRLDLLEQLAVLQDALGTREEVDRLRADIARLQSKLDDDDEDDDD